ncbi:hypothetical protein [Dyadobacter sp. NIV53]|uniref:hypothetical protein n=1 Tax=Dyadobacter sp. NIV53 TaxID=2861765 RepID=UPI001C877900|nr:hypothetical protein [Dyadobacter sp. NIV53]
MLLKNDQLLTRLTVRIQNLGQTIGSGVICCQSTFQEKVYIFTAAHCLYSDSDQFTKPLEFVEVLFYNPQEARYVAIQHTLNFNLVSPIIQQDVAVLIFDRSTVEEITGLLPLIQVVQDRHSINNFACKGFPSAANGKELILIKPVWSQHLAIDNRFQLLLTQDFSSAESARFEVDGYSGSGIFLVEENNIYLFGIFTRFLDAGKIIYGQYIVTFNDLLRENFLPTLPINSFGGHGLTLDYFQKTASQAVRNLGPRFSEYLNFQLPIARQFNDLAKDSYFKLKITQVVDTYLTADRFGARGSSYVNEIVETYDTLRQYVLSWFNVSVR